MNYVSQVTDWTLQSSAIKYQACRNEKNSGVTGSLSKNVGQLG